MKTLAIIAVIGALAATVMFMGSSSEDALQSQFNQYLATYQKTYSNNAEYEMRFKIFSDNVRRNEEHNSKGLSYTLGINQFSDWTNEEYRRMLGRLHADPIPYKCETWFTPGAKKDSVDWVTGGAVNAVENQGSCGSCWAFGTVGAIEGAYAVKTGNLLKFSEQQFVDCCSNHCSGCNGGFQNEAMIWAESHDLCLESDYPYHPYSGKCSESKCEHKVHAITSCSSIQPYSVNDLTSALSVAPVSVTVDAGSYAFQSYASGVLESSSCGTALNHAVLGVGFGNEGGKDFIKIKNSWGSSWGSQGYIKVGTGGPKEGYCGIFMDNSIVNV